MDNTFMIEADYPAGTKILVYDGYDEDGNIQTLDHILQEPRHLVPTDRFLGRRIIAIDLSGIYNQGERRDIEEERVAAWALRRRPYDNNNPDPNAIPLGRIFVASGGRKSRRRRKNKKSKMRRSMKRRSNRRRRR
jgi:hypothetical protein